MALTPVPVLAILSLLVAILGLVPAGIRVQQISHALLVAVLGASVLDLQRVIHVRHSLLVLPALFLLTATVLSVVPVSIIVAAPALFLASTLVTLPATALALLAQKTRKSPTEAVSVTLAPDPPSPASSRLSFPEKPPRAFLPSSPQSPHILPRAAPPTLPPTPPSRIIHLLYLLLAAQFALTAATTFTLLQTLLSSSLGANHAAILHISDAALTTMALLSVLLAYWRRGTASSAPESDLERNATSTPPRRRTFDMKRFSPSTLKISPRRLRRDANPDLSPLRLKSLGFGRRATPQHKQTTSSSSSFFSPRPKRTPLPLSLRMSVRTSVDVVPSPIDADPDVDDVFTARTPRTAASAEDDDGSTMVHSHSHSSSHTHTHTRAASTPSTSTSACPSAYTRPARLIPPPPLCLPPYPHPHPHPSYSHSHSHSHSHLPTPPSTPNPASDHADSSRTRKPTPIPLRLPTSLALRAGPARRGVLVRVSAPAASTSTHAPDNTSVPAAWQEDRYTHAAYRSPTHRARSLLRTRSHERLSGAYTNDQPEPEVVVDTHADPTDLRDPFAHAVPVRVCMGGGMGMGMGGRYGYGYEHSGSGSGSRARRARGHGTMVRPHTTSGAGTGTGVGCTRHLHPLELELASADVDVDVDASVEQHRRRMSAWGRLPLPLLAQGVPSSPPYNAASTSTSPETPMNTCFPHPPSSAPASTSTQSMPTRRRTRHRRSRSHRETSGLEDALLAQRLLVQLES
ncbi:hypothetical protein H0H81_010649 [Sphagnurus paluster]|uniref:Uncharacterized protein n=1 Tax=Sphagnurus paluster TaxID=117069 RepID=A0A9P7GIX9_9AGAR|nr:hypothetical protein H0H81_010649 [Sphagnurus paluster]